MDTAIAGVQARRIWDSRGRPTVEVDVTLGCGATGRGIAPAGASRGAREAIDLRDGGTRLGGLDVGRAVAAVNGEIAKALAGRDAADQRAIDETLIALDGTHDKSRLGGNASIATSMAVLHAAASAVRLPLWRHLAGESPVRIPLPEIQIFGGGAHAGRRVDVQDFMVMPLGAMTFAGGLEWVAEIYRAAGDSLRARGRAAGVADEGGHWPAFDSNEEALSLLVESIEQAGLEPGRDVGISLDIAASEFRHNGRYRLALEDRELDSDAMVEMLAGWLERYPIVSIEDPLAEDDEAGWRLFCERVASSGRSLQVIGDDLLVTNADLVERAAREKLCNAVLIKPNQAGTITETRAALEAGRRAGFATIVSARSGETEDATIAHLAIGWNAGQLKVGSFTRSERMAKWNEVIRIEEVMGADAVYAGRRALAGSVDETLTAQV